MVYLLPPARLTFGLGSLLAIGCIYQPNPAFTISDPFGGTGAGSTTSGTTADSTTDRTTSDVTGTQTTADASTTDPHTSGTTAAAPFCGDGEIDPGEECDDRNSEPADGCEPDCTVTPPPPTCGDGELDDGEQCDDGNGSDGDACKSNCFLNVCGDAIVNQDVEECDDGNKDETDDCLSGCVAATCGDAIVHQGVEECDDGNATDTDACLPGCVAAKCGDAIVHDGVEQCDDGNGDDADDCTNACQLNTCGDGVFQFETEECDDSALAVFAGLPAEVCQGCKLNGLCFMRTNTAGGDFDEGASEHYTWFSKCQAQPGNRVHVLIVDKQQRLFYGSGTKTKEWTDNQLTSSAAPGDQWSIAKHVPIAMNANDRLYLFARSAKPNDPMDMNCQTRLGDGYGLAIYSQGAMVPKLTFMPYKGGGTDTPRTFPMWNTDRELAKTDGITPLCQPAGSLKPLLSTRIAIMITEQ